MTVTKTRAALAIEALRATYAIAGPGDSSMEKAGRLRLCGAVDLELGRPWLSDEGRRESLDRAVDRLLFELQEELPLDLTIVLHPSECTSFVAQLPPGLSRGELEARLRREAALLASRPMRVLAVHPIGAQDGPGPDGAYVLALEDAFADMLRRLTAPLGSVSGFIAAPVAVAAAVAAGGSAATSSQILSGASSLAIGAYAEYTEYCVAGPDAAAPLLIHAAPTRSDTDRAYFALNTLRRAGLEARTVRSASVYGDHAGQETLRQLGAVLPVETIVEMLDAEERETARRVGADVLAPAVCALRSDAAGDVNLLGWWGPGETS